MNIRSRVLISVLTVFASIVSGVSFANEESSIDQIWITSVEQSKNLDLSRIPHCRVRIGDGCGTMDQEEIMECVREVAKGNPTDLDISQTYLKIQQIVETMQSCSHLQKLDCSHNGVSASDAAPMCRFLESNKTIQCLNLKCNELGGEGVTAFAKMLYHNDTLQELDLSDNIQWDSRYAYPVPESGDAAALEIADALKVNRSLMKLGLRNNRISKKDGLFCFGNTDIALKKGESWRQIDFNRNPLEPEYFEELNPEFYALNIVREMNPDLVILFDPS